MVTRTMLISAATCALAIMAACNSQDGGGGGAVQEGGRRADLRGLVVIDASSTVYPLAQAAAGQFTQANPAVRVSVERSGTSRGSSRGCASEIGSSDPSRPRGGEDVPGCREGEASYAEVQVANDAIAVTTNKVLPIDCMTTGQLKKLWRKGSDVENYSDLGFELPNQAVRLYGPGPDSSAFDFFTHEINGEKGVSRVDYQPAADDDALVQGVSGDKGGLGYSGYTQFQQTQENLNLVRVDGGDGCVKPSVETIQSGDYEPLGRPIFMYPSEEALRRPEVRALMSYIVDNHRQISELAQAVPMSDRQARAAKRRLGS